MEDYGGIENLNLFPKPEEKEKREEKKLFEIEKNEESGSMMFFSEDDIDNYVDLPLRESVKKLYNEKGIKIIDSSANKEDITKGEVYIIIDSEYLSKENKEMAESIGDISRDHEGKRDKEGLTIKVDINEDSTVKEIEEEMNKKISLLEAQEPSWIPLKNAQEIREEHNLDDDEYENDEEMKKEENAEFAYDNETDKFFISKWHKDITERWRKEDKKE